MARRSFEAAGDRWTVALSGRSSSYSRDQVSVVFEKGTGSGAVRRSTRFRPLGSPRADAALAELSDAQLRAMLASSQPAWTSPELSYGEGARPA